MKATDFVCIRKSSSREFEDSVKNLLKKGYELYGPPVMQVSPTLVSSGYGYSISGKDTYDFMQILIKPVKEKIKTTLPLLKFPSQGIQNCSDCSCDPATPNENRSCGRTSS